jgi:hypothetical protein
LVLVVAMSMTGVALGRVLHPAPDQPGTTNGPVPVMPVPTPNGVAPTSSSQPVVPRGNPRVD